MIKELDKVKITLNMTYGIVHQINSKLREKSNSSYEDAMFLDVVDFSITSYSLSLVKSYLMNTHKSITTFLMMRNIIENLALRAYYKAGNVEKKHVELLRLNGYLQDYIQYSKIKSIDKAGLVNREKLIKDFEEVKKAYLKYGKDEKYITKEKLPFLLKRKLTYNKLINEYLKELKIEYQLLSLYIHPHYYNIHMKEDYDDLDILNYDELISKIMYYVLEITTEYQVNKNNIIPFDKEYVNLVKNRQAARLFMESALQQENIFLKFASIYNDSYLQHFNTEIANVFIDLSSDSNLGLTECLKVKFKAVLEVLATFYKMISFCEDNKGATEMLMILYTEYQIIKILKPIFKKKRDSSEYLKQIISTAYDLYKKVYPNVNIEKDEFSKNFIKTNGFFLDENKKVPSLNELVKDYINDMTLSAEISLFEELSFEQFKKLMMNTEFVDYNTEQKILLKDHILMTYNESILMGHASGYLYFANPGAFNSGDESLVLLEKLILNFLRKEVILDGYDENAKLYEEYLNIVKEKIKIIEFKLYSKTLKNY